MKKDDKRQKEINKLMPSEKELLAADESGERILVLSRGHMEDGTPHYTYLAVLPSKIMAFKKAEAEGGFYYEDFGEILAEGDGLEPPEEVKKRMEKEYGFNHNFEEEVIEKATEFQKKQDLVDKYSGKKKPKEEK